MKQKSESRRIYWEFNWNELGLNKSFNWIVFVAAESEPLSRMWPESRNEPVAGAARQNFSRWSVWVFQSFLSVLHFKPNRETPEN